MVKLIPAGRVSSYGAIARYLGASRSARVVGWAMQNAHTLPYQLPAHRVLNRQGLLTGKHHYSRPDEMQERLEAEGLLIHKDQVQDFDRYFWDPATELM